MSETLYHVSANPHVRDNGSTQKIMLDVIIALLPATIFGIYIFGASAALTVATVSYTHLDVYKRQSWWRCPF